MKDGASVNEEALNRIKFVFTKILSAMCFYHTLNNAGNHFKVRDLLSFGSLWISLFKHSLRAKLIWQELTGRTQSPTVKQDSGQSGRCLNSYLYSLVM